VTGESSHQEIKKLGEKGFQKARATRSEKCESPEKTKIKEEKYSMIRLISGKKGLTVQTGGPHPEKDCR